MSALLSREAGLPWTPEVAYAKDLYLEARSYQEWADEWCPVGVGLRPSVNRRPLDGDDVLPVGRWYLMRRTLSPRRAVTHTPWGTRLSTPYEERNGLDLYRNGRPYGRVSFDAEVVIPVLYDEAGDPWMSPTPAEVLSNRPGLRMARGNVLVGGLGLGMAARMIRAKAGVSSVTVVERNPDVARVFGGIDGVEVVVGDFYEAAERDGEGFDAIVADIWECVNDARDDARFQAMKAAHPRVWGWGDYAAQERRW